MVQTFPPWRPPKLAGICIPGIVDILFPVIKFPGNCCGLVGCTTADAAGFWLNRAMIESLDIVCFCAFSWPVSCVSLPVLTMLKSSNKFWWLSVPFWLPFVFVSALGVVVVFVFWAPTNSSNSELLSLPPPKKKTKFLISLSFLAAGEKLF